jgi:hypothetical protein
MKPNTSKDRAVGAIMGTFIFGIDVILEGCVTWLNDTDEAYIIEDRYRIKKNYVFR